VFGSDLRFGFRFLKFSVSIFPNYFLRLSNQGPPILLCSRHFLKRGWIAGLQSWLPWDPQNMWCTPNVAYLSDEISLCLACKWPAISLYTLILTRCCTLCNSPCPYQNFTPRRFRRPRFRWRSSHDVLLMPFPIVMTSHHRSHHVTSSSSSPSPSSPSSSSSSSSSSVGPTVATVDAVCVWQPQQKTPSHSVVSCLICFQ